MRLIGELYAPAIAFLPIGDRFTMDPVQAARACELLGVKQVVPMHWGTFPLLTGTPAALKTLVEPAACRCWNCARARLLNDDRPLKARGRRVIVIVEPQVRTAFRLPVCFDCPGVRKPAWLIAGQSVCSGADWIPCRASACRCS